MKKLLLTILLLILGTSYMYSQKTVAVIKPASVTTPDLTTVGTNSISSGLRIVRKGTYAYLNAMNTDLIATNDTNVIISTTWTLVSKPGGSNAVLSTFNGNGTKFLADTNGEYQVKLSITTKRGTDDTTMSIYASYFAGVGNFQGVAGDFPKCMTCHTSAPNDFSAIYSNWSGSVHANAFKNAIDSVPGYTSAGFGISCLKCHVTGYDNNLVANNGGFDDIAKTVGYVWYAPPKPGKWDSLKTAYPKLVNVANIGCEMCHGAGTEHATSGNKAKIQISASDAACAQCHDAPWRHNKVAQFENSKHAEALYESGFSTRGLTTGNLSDCMRCHDGKGYILFTKGKTQSTPIAPNLADHDGITCATCHDPHGNSRTASLRPTPATSDTLANGYKYTSVVAEETKTCLNCHKDRRVASTYYLTNKPTSISYGSHYNCQTDVLLGKNAVPVDNRGDYQSSLHAVVISKQCVTCHMAATTDTGTVNRDKVGGHSFAMKNEATGFDNADNACGTCHGMKGSFDNFIASKDYDGNGTKEAVQTEINGLLKLVRTWLPPKGIDSVNTSQFAGPDSMLYRKALYNYNLMVKEGSFGLHNTKFSVDVLQRTILALGGPNLVGVEKNSPKVLDYTLNQNYPNPFNPSTTISFIVPKSGNVKIRIYNTVGVLVKEIFNREVGAGSYQAVWNGDNQEGKKVASGVYIYKLETPSFSSARKMVLAK